MFGPASKTALLTVLLVLPAAALAPRVQGAGVTDATDEFTQAQLEELSKSLQGDVEALRGATFAKPVDVALADAASFRTYVTLRMQRMMPPERVAAEEDAYKLLGLVPHDLSYLRTMMAMLESQVGGFYDPTEDRFFLMKTFTGGIAQVILAHELTHALDDQRWDLDAELAKRLDNSDALFAYQSVVEGSGVAVMNRWMLTNGGKLSIEEIQRIANLGMEGMKDVPPALWKPLLAAYLRGAAFLAKTESATTAQLAPPDGARIDAAFEDPPRSSEQVLHPAKYWEERDEPLAVEVAVGALPEGVRVVARDTLGELGCTLFTEKPSRRKGLRSQLQVQQSTYTSKAGEGWGGDRAVLLAKDRARALVWWTCWDTPADADEFAEAAATVGEHVTATLAAWSEARGLEVAPVHRLERPATPLEGRTVRLVSAVGFAPAELDAVLAALVAELPAPTEAPAVPAGG